MDPLKLAALALDPSLIMEAQGMTADPWQQEFLLSQDRLVLLNCSRQSGKSSVVAALALHTALFQRDSLVLLFSPSQRQSHELFRKILDAYNACGRPVATTQDAQTLSKLELANGSRIIGLPGKEATIRGFSKPRLVLLDEAARIADPLYRTVRPMCAVSGGRIIALSSPFGQRGWFWVEWLNNPEFTKWEVPWQHCPRITPEFIESERLALGDDWIKQEYECSFTAMTGLVYPDFEKCLVPLDDCPSWENQRLYGGIDFGFRNPFAAIWGVLDYEDVLWITGERYLSQCPLHEHRNALKGLGKSIVWFADPAGETERQELVVAGLTVRKGDNDIRAGIAGVSARIATGRLRVCEQTCPNLVRESRLYRYPDDQEKAYMGEKPIDKDNHALAALRYLVSRLDARFMARFRKRGNDATPEELAAEEKEEQEQIKAKGSKPWLRLDNDELWA